MVGYSEVTKCFQPDFDDRKARFLRRSLLDHLLSVSSMSRIIAQAEVLTLALSLTLRDTVTSEDKGRRCKVIRDILGCKLILQVKKALPAANQPNPNWSKVQHHLKRIRDQCESGQTQEGVKRRKLDKTPLKSFRKPGNKAHKFWIID